MTASSFTDGSKFISADPVADSMHLRTYDLGRDGLISLTLGYDEVRTIRRARGWIYTRPRLLLSYARICCHDFLLIHVFQEICLLLQ